MKVVVLLLWDMQRTSRKQWVGGEALETLSRKRDVSLGRLYIVFDGGLDAYG